MRQPSLSMLVLMVQAGCLGAASASNQVFANRSMLESHPAPASRPIGGVDVRGGCDVIPAAPPTVARRDRLRRTDIGRCHLSHLGWVKVQAEQHFDFGARTESAQLTLTTADGDEIRASNVGP